MQLPVRRHPRLDRAGRGHVGHEVPRPSHRFYSTASAVVFEHDGSVNKFVGDGAHVELTAIGDTVNTTARLAAAARAGEILVTIAAAASAGLGRPLERRSLSLKGKQGPTEVVVLGV